MALEAYRADNGEAVDDDAAREAWSRAAWPTLAQVARQYGSLTTPDDLAEAVQALSGVRTRAAGETWLDDVLDAVDAECVARTEPLLSAFCIGEDGHIGTRYAESAQGIDPAAGTDIEMHAATQRLEAHRCHGAAMPVDGGQPVLPRQLAKVRAAAPKTKAKATRAPRAKAAPKPVKPEPPKRPVCPTCFLELPLAGGCYNCDPD